MPAFRSSAPLFPNYGTGVGLRAPHLAQFLDPARRPSRVRWVEVISDNYLPGSRFQNSGAKRSLLEVRRDLPVALHGVNLSLGSASGLKVEYARNLKKLADEIQPIVVSDHVCWTGIQRRQTLDLNPLPYTLAQAEFVASQIRRAQDILQRRILIENVSSYLSWEASEMTEAEFLREILERADCGLLLDLNNVYVSATNHGFDAREYLETLPWHRVGQLHMAGHEEQDGLLIDTHGAPVCEPVWALYRWCGEKFGHASAMIERDANLPAWEELELEVARLESGFVPNQPLVPVGTTLPPAEWAGAKPAVAGTGAAPDPRVAAFIEREREAQHRWVDSLLGEFEVRGIAGDARVSARSRFEVYEQAFWTRINEFVASDFPRFRDEVGEDAFDQLVLDLVRETPPTEESLYEISAAFLEGLTRRQHPSLALARADWARRLAQLARARPFADGVETRLEKLGEESPEELGRIRIVLPPSLQVLPEARTVFWFDRGAREKSFPEAEWPALDALIRGLPIGQWQGVAGLQPENVQRWAQEGLICGYEKIQAQASPR